MAGCPPGVLVIADYAAERTLIMATLAAAGFAVIVPSDEASAATAGLLQQPLAAAVCALRGRDCVGVWRALQRRHPGLPIVDVADANKATDEDIAPVVARPLDTRALLDAVYDVVLRDQDVSNGAGHAAEFGIAAAHLACLHSRCVAASASGASRLAHDLTRQIGRMQASSHNLSATARAA